jgi:hypothetical protein
MKRSIFIIGLVLLMAGIANAQNQKTFSKIVAKGNTGTAFGNYIIKVGDQPVMLEGEKVTCYQITYDSSPVSVEILVVKTTLSLQKVYLSCTAAMEPISGSTGLMKNMARKVT